jgi:hypothetical protein
MPLDAGKQAAKEHDHEPQSIRRCPAFPDAACLDDGCSGRRTTLAADGLTDRWVNVLT